MKIKRREGKKRNVWEIFVEVVREDDSSAGYATVCVIIVRRHTNLTVTRGDFKKAYGTPREL